MVKKITPKILSDYRKSEGKCPFCGCYLFSAGLHGAGRMGWESEHGNPISKGGKRTKAACTQCNRMKGSKTTSEFKAWMEQKQKDSLLYKFTGNKSRL